MMRKTAIGVLLGGGAAALILALGAAGTFQALELDLYDWRMRRAAAHPPAVHRDIVIVELNDTTIRDLEKPFGRWPWPRAGLLLPLAPVTLFAAAGLVMNAPKRSRARWR